MKRALGFMNKALPITYNTYIGSVSANISTPALLASNLAIDVSRISNFEIVGSDIQCRITGSYEIPNSFLAYDATTISYYDDMTDGLVTKLNELSFRFSTTLKYAYFPNCTTITSTGFQIVYDTCVLYIPRCTDLGGSSANNAVFDANPPFNNKVYCHPSLATNNGGLPDGDLSAVGNITYVTNFTAPNAVTTLAAGTIYNTSIQLNFTTPSSTNAIDFYECYADGVYKNKITASGGYITGLTASTSYNITLIAVDIFLNKSVFSNSLSVTTTNRAAVDTDAIAYISASSNTIYQDIIDDMYVSLKSNSLYTKLQVFYPFLGTTAIQHKWNGKNPLDTNAAFRLTFFGTGTFSNLGYQCNGTNAYANTYFNSRTNQSINNNGMTLVSGTNNVKNEAIEIGCYTGGNDYNFLNVKRYTSNGERSFISAGIGVSQTGVFEAKGIFTASKTSQNNAKLYRNNTILATATTGVVGTLCNLNNYIGVLNNGGSPYAYSSQRIQFVAFHEGLSDAEVATLHTIIDTFENTLGRKTW